MFAVIFIFGNFYFLRIAGKPQKVELAKFRSTRYIKSYETTFQNPQSSYFKLSIRAFFVFDMLFIFFLKVLSAYTLFF